MHVQFVRLYFRLFGQTLTSSAAANVLSGTLGQLNAQSLFHQPGFHFPIVEKFKVNAM